MGDKSRASVVMHFADGEVIDTWQSVSLKDAFTDPLGQLELETSPPRPKFIDYRNRLAKGELVTILVNGVNQGGFLIQTVERTHGARGGMSIRITCHTPLVTPYQGHVDPDLSVKAQTDVPVEDVVLKALGPFGFDRIIADSHAHVDAISGRPIGRGSSASAALTVKQLKHQESKAQKGETAYQYCARIFTRLGVALRCAADGTLLLAAPDFNQDPAYSLVSDLGTSGRDGDRFVGELHIHDSNDDQYSESQVRGVQQDKPDQDSTERPVARVKATDVLPARSAYSSFAASHKPKIGKDSNARDAARCRSVAKLELGLRAVNAFTVSGEVDGWISKTGRVWTVDTVANVYVEAEGIDEPMWVMERTLMQDPGGGQRCRLKLCPLGALILGELPH
jgi:hypothetical protein